VLNILRLFYWVDAMTDDANAEYNIQSIKRLFFDPQYGGSRQAETAVLKLVEGYRAAFQYLNAAVPASAQREIESETESEYWITPEQLNRQLRVLLVSGHLDDAARDRFRDAATQLGFTIHYEPGFDRVDSETDYRAKLADILAAHFTGQVMLERAVARGGR
jgi:hypothetical protein